MTGVLGSLVRAARPHQWVKNLFVFAPLFFSEGWVGREMHEIATSGRPSGLALRVCATFALFCLLSSGVYLMNDVLDREADRAHPLKRRRPVASGELSVPVAVAASAALIAAALAWARFGLERTPLLGVCLVYVVIQVLYSSWLKRVVIVDVMCIASGFVLRLVAGGDAAWVRASTWILVCTIFLSLLLALCKRRHEVVTLGDDAPDHRPILAHYPTALLDQLISAATAATLVTYALYTVDPRTARTHGLLLDNGDTDPILAVTIPFVIFGVFRYLYLVYRQEQGGSPTRTLARDVPSLLNGLLYAATVVAIFRHAGR